MRFNFFAVLLWASLLVASAVASPFNLGPESKNLVLVPGFNHADVALPIQPAEGNFDFNQVQVSSNAAWVTPQMDAAGQKVILKFTTAALPVASRTATITATHGTDTATVTLTAASSALNVFKLLDDPHRSRMYGIQLNGILAGSLLVIDPLTASPVSSITVGRRPTGMAISDDGSELFVINCVDKTISVIDLQTLAVAETIVLPVFGNFGESTTTANIGVGPGQILYYTDGAENPGLHVFNRSSYQVLQSQSASIGTRGFGDFALNKEKSRFYAWTQSGWNGWYPSYQVCFEVSSTGTLTHLESSYESLSGYSMEAPVLLSNDGQIVFIKSIATDPSTIANISQTYPADIYSITPGGEIAITNSAIFQSSNGNKLLDLPVSTSIHAITSDYARLVSFDPVTRKITTTDLFTLIGAEALGRVLSPAPDSSLLQPAFLTWAGLPGANRYEVYFGSSFAAVNAATTVSSEYLGSTLAPTFPAPSALTPGGTYYWRVDAILDSHTSAGSVYSFTLSPITVSASQVETSTVQSHADHRVKIQLNSVVPGLSWSASADQTWVTFASDSGTTPAELELRLNAEHLEPGLHSAIVTISGATGSLFMLPVRFTVDPLKVTHLKSDPLSSITYAVSEDTATAGARAYLMQLDVATESILRVVPAGTSVTDLAIHQADGRIYLPNWLTGSLLAYDKATLALEQTYPFSPFQGMGHGDDDVYRVAAGKAGRLVVEEQDQWVDFHIFDTVNGTKLDGSGGHEGGGVFDPSGRFYYHGENNISNAEIVKFDVTGDVMTTVKSIRVSSYSYYGSRVVVGTEDGQSIFWNGSFFNADLVEKWSMADQIYCASADGRLAFGDRKIYDTSTRQHILSMPVTTRVSAFNSTTNKLVLQKGARLHYYPLDFPVPFPAPVLSAGSSAATTSSLPVTWTDNSLETGFILQYRPVGTPDWIQRSPSPAANVAALTLTGLQSAMHYEIRIQATSPVASSPWSDVLVLRTQDPIPSGSTLTLSASQYDGFVSLYGSTSVWYLPAVMQRRQGDEGPWVNLPAYNSPETPYSYTYTDTSTVAGATYQYRLKALPESDTEKVSKVISITMPAQRPGFFGGEVKITDITASHISLAWLDVGLETGWRIERSNAVFSGWTHLATLDADATSYTDTTVVQGHSYVYRVRPFNVHGFSPSQTMSSVVTALDMEVTLEDDFDPELDDGEWTSTSVSTSVNGGTGFNGTKALWFGHSDRREAVTRPVDASGGGLIQFSLRAGNSRDGNQYWESPSQYEYLLFSCSTDGITWQTLELFSLNEPKFSEWAKYAFMIPANARSKTLQFRWWHDPGATYRLNPWALDNVRVRSYSEDILTISSPPVSKLVMAGDSASLSVTVNQPTSSFQWYKDGELVPDATLATYSVASAESSHGGSYTCEIRYGDEVLTTQPVMLGVVEMAVEGPVYTRVGESFSVGIRVYPAILESDLSFAWTRTAEGDLAGIGTVSGELTSTLTVSGATASAEATYLCRVTYQNEYLTRTLDVGPYEVRMLRRPTIQPIADVDLVSGSSVDIAIEVVDLPLTVQVGGLPKGLFYDAATQRIRGSIKGNKSYTLTVNASNAQGAADPVSFQLNVVGFPAALAGSYQGVFLNEAMEPDPALQHGGQMAFKITNKGAASGTVMIQGKNRRFAVKSVEAAPDGAWARLEADIDGPDGSPLQVAVDIVGGAGLHEAELHTAGEAEPQTLAEGQVVRNEWSNANPAPDAGLINVALLPPEWVDASADDSNVPKGTGFMNLKLTPQGIVTCKGRLADGQAVTGSTILGLEGHIPVFASLYRGTGSFGTLMTYEDGEGSGTAYWGKDDQGETSKDRFYKRGIERHELTVTGGLYVRPAANEPLFATQEDANSPATLMLTRALLPHPGITQVLSFTGKHQADLPREKLLNPHGLMLKMNAATGTFTGKFKLEDPNPLKANGTLRRTVTFQGSLIPGLERGCGYFLLPELPSADIPRSSLSNTPVWSGSVELIPEAE